MNLDGQLVLASESKEDSVLASRIRHYPCMFVSIGAHSVKEGV